MALSSRAGPGPVRGRAGRREGERGATGRTTLTSRRPSLAASDHRTQVCTVRWQVFGLMSTDLGTLSRLDPPSGRRFPDAVASSAVDGGRSHSPLRGSPGFPPGSLLPRPARVGGANQLQAPPYTGPLTSLTTTCCGGVSRRVCRTASGPPVRRRLRPVAGRGQGGGL